MAAGFVHGVLNSDNIAISGESFDYGPWRFTPDWDPGFTAAYFDQTGLYAFGRQPEAIQWDLAQLGGCLAFLCDAAPLSAILEDWGRRFETALIEAFVRRVGVEPRGTEEDRVLGGAILTALQSRTVGIDRLFFDWRGGRIPPGERYAGEPFRKLADALDGRVRPPAHPYWSDPEPCSLHIEEVEALWASIAERDDWSRFEAKIAAIRRMGEAMEEG